MSPTDLLRVPTLKDLCARTGLRPSRASGQNFLVNARTLAHIVDAVAPQPEETVVEVGAGFGVLTTALAPRAARIIAVERDTRIVPALREIIAPHANVTIVASDILALLHDGTSARGLGITSPWTLAANLPYSITSDFLAALVDRVADGSLPPPTRAVLLLQREVVARLIGATAKDRGVLTLVVQLHAYPRRVTRVPASHFWPTPKVESTVVALEDWRSPEDIRVLLNGAPEGTVTRAAFLHAVRAAFAHRRQKLRRGLASVWGGAVDNALVAAGIPPDARPEELTFAQWIALVRAYTPPHAISHPS